MDLLDDLLGQTHEMAAHDCPLEPDSRAVRMDQLELEEAFQALNRRIYDLEGATDAELLLSQAVGQGTAKRLSGRLGELVVAPDQLAGQELIERRLPLMPPVVRLNPGQFWSVRPWYLAAQNLQTVGWSIGGQEIGDRAAVA